MNEDELKLLDEKLKESDLGDALKLVEGATEESLTQLREDIEYFLKDESERKLEQQEEIQSEDVNPFTALVGAGKGKKKTKSGDKEKDKEKEKIQELKDKGAKADSYTEGVVRKLGEMVAASSCFKVFDVYKKAHGMESHPDPFD